MVSGKMAFVLKKKEKGFLVLPIILALFLS
jgi:hypothetical protein